MHFIDWFWRIFEYQFYFFVQNIFVYYYFKKLWIDKIDAIF